MPNRARVDRDRLAKVVAQLRSGHGVWVHLSPQAIASLIDVAQGKTELADAHIAVLRLFEEAAPLDSHPATLGEIADADALEQHEGRREIRHCFTSHDRQPVHQCPWTDRDCTCCEKCETRAARCRSEDPREARP
jgi:hypothetical protein